MDLGHQYAARSKLLDSSSDLNKHAVWQELSGAHPAGGGGENPPKFKKTRSYVDGKLLKVASNEVSNLDNDLHGMI